jgi:hypothetical protein
MLMYANDFESALNGLKGERNNFERARLQPRRRCRPEGGGGFNPRNEPKESSRASAPERLISPNPTHHKIAIPLQIISPFSLLWNLWSVIFPPVL